MILSSGIWFASHESREIGSESSSASARWIKPFMRWKHHVELGVRNPNAGR